MLTENREKPSTPIVDQKSRAHFDRRRQQRQFALLRVALLHAGEAKELCIVKNISSNGLSARVYRTLAKGNEVKVEFRSGELLHGSVVWTRDHEFGMAFAKPVDTQAVLASQRIIETGKRQRLPRIELLCPGKLTSGARSVGVILQDISQGGARVQIDTPELARSNVLLHLPDLSPIAAVIRWAKGNEAGLSFNDYLAFESLARWIELRRGGDRG